MNDKFDAIVVGAGISGLTAAYLLCKKNLRVALIAPAPDGGMVRTVIKEGFTLEQGPNVLLEKVELSKLIDQLGLRSQMIYPNDPDYGQYIWHNGKSWRVPRKPLQFIRTALFSWSEKVRILSTLLMPNRLHAQADDESVLTFLSRGLGEDIVRRVIDPVLKGVYGGRVEELSARALFPSLWKAANAGHSVASWLSERRRSGARPRIFTFRGGMKTLSESLMRESGHELTRINTLVTSATGNEGSYSVTLESGQTILAHKLVLAVPLASATKIFQPAADLSKKIERIRYAPLSVVHCETGNAPSFPDATFGILFPEGTRDYFLGAMFNSMVFPHTAPPGKFLLTLCFGGIAAGEQGGALDPSDDLVSGVCREYLGVPQIRVLARQVWTKAIPQYEPGHVEIVSEIERFERAHPGLLLASVDRGGVGVADRVKSVMELLNESR